jgi:hypothetical protein
MLYFLNPDLYEVILMRSKFIELTVLRSHPNPSYGTYLYVAAAVVSRPHPRA